MSSGNGPEGPAKPVSSNGSHAAELPAAPVVSCGSNLTSRQRRLLLNPNEESRGPEATPSQTEDGSPCMRAQRTSASTLALSLGLAGPDVEDWHLQPLLRCRIPTEHQVAMAVSTRTLQDPAHSDGCFAGFVTGKFFTSLASFVIVLNGIYVGYSAEYALAHIGNGTNDIIDGLDWFFNLFYLVELVLRLMVFGRSFFNIHSPEFSWNIFDFALVLFSIYEKAFAMLTGNQKGSLGNTMRLLRMLKMVKMLRVIRVMKVFHELNMMVMPIISSVKALFWTICMLLLILYMFGIVFMQAVHMRLSNSDEPEPTYKEELMEQWGTVLESILSLYQAITGGNDWSTYADPLKEDLPFYYYVFFLFYVAFLTFAVMNILTGIFVDNAMAISANEDRRDFKGLMKVKKQVLDGLHHVTLSFHDYRRCWARVEEVKAKNMAPVHDSPEHSLVQFAELVGMEESELHSLFIQYSNGMDSAVHMESFLDLALNVKGPAKSSDMHALMLDQLRLQRDIVSISRIFRTAFGNMEQDMVKLGQRLESIDMKLANREMGRQSSPALFGFMAMTSDTNIKTLLQPILQNHVVDSFKSVDRRYTLLLYGDENAGTDSVGSFRQGGSQYAGVKYDNGLLARFVRSQVFTAIGATVIIVNAGFLGYAATYALQNPQSPENVVILSADWFFNIFYFVELVLRMAVFHVKFFCNEDWSWNVFDFLLVAYSIYEVVSSVVTDGEKSGIGSTLRLLRILKMVKMLRLIRIMKFFTELRQLLMPLMGSVVALFWTIFMLSIILYLFSVVFMQGVVSAFDGGEPDNGEILLEHWGTVLKAMSCLYYATTGGNDWSLYANPLREMSFIYYMFFCFFIAFLTLAVLNILTGIFVEKAMAYTQDSESQVSEDIGLMKLKYDVLCQLEDKGRYLLTYNDFHNYLNDPGQSQLREVLEKFLDACDVTPEDADQLVFQVSRQGGEEGMDAELLLNALEHMKGNARSIDLMSVLREQTMVREQVRLIRKAAEHIAEEQTKWVKHLECGLMLAEEKLGAEAPSAVFMDATNSMELVGRASEEVGPYSPDSPQVRIRLVTERPNCVRHLPSTKESMDKLFMAVKEEVEELFDREPGDHAERVFSTLEIIDGKHWEAHSDHSDQRHEQIHELQQDLQRLLAFAWDPELRRHVMSLLSGLVHRALMANAAEPMMEVCWAFCQASTSLSFQDIEVRDETKATSGIPAPVVLILGHHGSHVSVIRPVAERWNKQGALVVSAVPCGVPVLMEEQKWATCNEIWRHVSQGRALILHCFGNLSFQYAATILRMLKETQAREGRGFSLALAILDSVGFVGDDLTLEEAHKVMGERPIKGFYKTRDTHHIKEKIDHKAANRCWQHHIGALGDASEVPSLSQAISRMHDSGFVSAASAGEGNKLGLLGLFTCPVLLVASHKDNLMPVAATQVLARSFQAVPNRLESLQPLATTLQSKKLFEPEGLGVHELYFPDSPHAMHWKIYPEDYWRSIDFLASRAATLLPHTRRSSNYEGELASTWSPSNLAEMLRPPTPSGSMQPSRTPSGLRAHSAEGLSTVVDEQPLANAPQGNNANPNFVRAVMHEGEEARLLRQASFGLPDNSVSRFCDDVAAAQERLAASDMGTTVVATADGPPVAATLSAPGFGSGAAGSSATTEAAAAAATASGGAGPSVEALTVFPAPAVAVVATSAMPSLPGVPQPPSASSSGTASPDPATAGANIVAAPLAPGATTASGAMVVAPGMMAPSLPAAVPPLPGPATAPQLPQQPLPPPTYDSGPGTGEAMQAPNEPPSRLVGGPQAAGAGPHGAMAPQDAIAAASKAGPTAAPPAAIYAAAATPPAAGEAAFSSLVPPVATASVSASASPAEEAGPSDAAACPECGARTLIDDAHFCCLCGAKRPEAALGVLPPMPVAAGQPPPGYVGLGGSLPRAVAPMPPGLDGHGGAAGPSDQGT